ncbi:MAG TPA: hypothetical protein VIG49_13175, partial [Acetobacteraceae bacterium]
MTHELVFRVVVITEARSHRFYPPIRFAARVRVDYITIHGERHGRKACQAAGNPVFHPAKRQLDHKLARINPSRRAEG